MAANAANDRTPLIERQSLPPPGGSAPEEDHPIFLRVCHSPWTFISQTGLVDIRATIVAYLTVLTGMLLDWEISRREKDDHYTPWRIVFQFSSLSFTLLWFYHAIVLAWSYIHLYFPNIDENDDRWAMFVFSAMAPPVQTARDRKRLYFSLFYTVTHVFVLMNVIIFWAVLVPNGHGYLPHGKGGASGLVSVFGAVGDFFTSEGWFAPFCIINLWGITGLIALLEIFFLNSVRRQVPVPTHVFIVMLSLGWYLGWAAIGMALTEHPPFFWMDGKAAGKPEVVAAYIAGFILLGLVVFSFMYGLIGMRENLTERELQAEPEPATAPA